MDKSDVSFWLLIGFVFLVGMGMGVIVSYFFAMNMIETIGSSFQVQSMNVTLDINETQIIEAQKAMRGIP